MRITTNAAKRVSKFLESRGYGLGIRVGVTTTGCSGYAYKLEFVDKLSATDIEHESNGIKMIVEDKWSSMLEGIELDYIKDGLNEGFEFINPNEKAKCGCGESFTV
jgi:iron-sulfur cluster assembly protein